MKGKWINNLTVADDMIWRTRVDNENKGAENWEKDWRFLVDTSIFSEQLKTKENPLI